MLTTADAAKFLQVSPRTVSMWCDKGKIQHDREAGTNNRLIKPSALADFMTDNLMPVPADLLELCKSE